MTVQTVALRINDMIGCCTVYGGAIVAVGRVAGMQGTIGAGRTRVGMAVLTLILMNGADDIAAVTAGTLGCTVAGHVRTMPGDHDGIVMVVEVVIVTGMTNRTITVKAYAVECGITGNCYAESTVSLVAILETAVGCRINMAVVAGMGCVDIIPDLSAVGRSMTTCTLGCTGGQQPGVMPGITDGRVMGREVAGVIERIIAAVTIGTAAWRTHRMVGRTTVCQCDKRTVGCAKVTVLAAAVRIMDNRLDIAAVACRTFAYAGQQAMRFCFIYVII
jgi:hypothetical protein